MISLTMKAIDDQTMDDLAKSSTILQCILSILEFECAKAHAQPQIISVMNNQAIVEVEDMTPVELESACMKVNAQFQRIDKRPTCKLEEYGKCLVRCEARPLVDYVRLT